MLRSNDDDDGQYRRARAKNCVFREWPLRGSYALFRCGQPVEVGNHLVVRLVAEFTVSHAAHVRLDQVVNGYSVSRSFHNILSVTIRSDYKNHPMNGSAVKIIRQTISARMSTLSRIVITAGYFFCRNENPTTGT